jgi:NTP pyrophosphatase (non-canonical NTP hydrolase)
MLNELATEIRQINAYNGWETPDRCSWNIDPNHIPAKLALVHTEVSEATEAFRIGDLENFGEELADTIIRILDLANGLGIDMDAAVRAKLEKNKTRGFRHGGKRV